MYLSAKITLSLPSWFWAGFVCLVLVFVCFITTAETEQEQQEGTLSDGTHTVVGLYNMKHRPLDPSW